MDFIWSLLILYARIMGTGIFSQPNVPEKLVSNFDGQWAHSAKWKKDLELANKTVAVIGSGAR